MATERVSTELNLVLEMIDNRLSLLTQYNAVIGVLHYQINSLLRQLRYPLRDALLELDDLASYINHADSTGFRQRVRGLLEDTPHITLSNFRTIVGSFRALANDIQAAINSRFSDSEELDETGY